MYELNLAEKSAFFCSSFVLSTQISMNANLLAAVTVTFYVFFFGGFAI